MSCFNSIFIIVYLSSNYIVRPLFPQTQQTKKQYHHYNKHHSKFQYCLSFMVSHIHPALLLRALSGLYKLLDDELPANLPYSLNV